MTKILPLFMALAVASPAAAQIKLDPPFTSNAVLQRGRTVPVSGHASPGSPVTVTLDGRSATGTAGKDGRWRVDLPSHEAGGPYRLEVESGKDKTALGNIMVGDVWLCSGQSNMEFVLRHATNAETEIAAADHPMLRLLTVPRQSSASPQTTFAQPAAWRASSPGSAANFSAACYIMGRDLQRHQGIAIGLIAASWGGSAIEEWISRPALETLPRYHSTLALLDRYAQNSRGAKAEWTAAIEKRLGARANPPKNAAWRPQPSTAAWESWGDSALSHFDGVGYYRTHVRLTEAQTGMAKLSIGAVDDIDLTRVNGRTAGAEEGWNTNRHYSVPAGLLKTGDNVIDIAVVDTGGGGGLWGNAPRSLTLADGSVLPLDKWSFARGPELAEIGIPMGQPWLGGSGRTTLFNGMIAPLGNYPVKGFAWYQGEANVADAAGYAELMPLLIGEWRRRFGATPFLMVQLAGFGPLTSKPVNHPWAQLRDVQRKVADADPQTGLASALDVGQVGDIHPTDKQVVGARLALAARHIALGENIVARGPAPVGVTRDAAGIVVHFTHGPLKLVAGGEALGFELCDAAKQCRFVPGRLTGESILLPADPAAVEVRYLWQASPLVNLYNEAGLPATGFTLPVR